MRGLGATDMLRLWEIGEGLTGVERAVALLHVGLPNARLDDLYDLGIGQRDALLFQLRERTFGPTLRCCTECPRCASRLEIQLPTSALRVTSDTEDADEVGVDGDGLFTHQSGEWRIRFRVPNSRDLAAVAAVASEEEGMQELVGRCVAQVQRVGAGEDETVENVDVAALPPAVLSAVSSELARRDPQAVLTMSLRCAACGHAWKSVFDIGSFFYTEVSAQAQRLAREICVLARAFGWSERDILAMSARRRQLYLQEAEA